MPDTKWSEITIDAILWDLYLMVKQPTADGSARLAAAMFLIERLESENGHLSPEIRELIKKVEEEKKKP